MQYKKKPVTIDAIQYNSNTPAIEAFMGDKIAALKRVTDDNSRVIALEIHTLEGVMRADLGDWIIKGIKGEFYPCKPDIFEQTYTPLKELIPEEIPEFKESLEAFKEKQFRLYKEVFNTLLSKGVDAAAEECYEKFMITEMPNH